MNLIKLLAVIHRENVTLMAETFAGRIFCEKRNSQYFGIRFHDSNNFCKFLGKNCKRLKKVRVLRKVLENQNFYEFYALPGSNDNTV